MKLLFLTFMLVPALGYGGQSNIEIIDKIWEVGKAESCTNKMRASFSEKKLKRLKKKLGLKSNLSDLQIVLNNFLFSLGKSHTEFFGPEHEGFHFFRSHSKIRNKSAPAIPNYANPGVQFFKGKNSNKIRSVFDGFPAQKAGLLVGDIILKSNNKPFRGYWHTTGDKTLRIKRGKTKLNKVVSIKNINLSEAMFNAQKNSVKVFSSNGKKIGYIKLWTGTHPESAKHLRETAIKFQPSVDSMVLDLRDGYGGAWWDHLDAFYKDRKSFFTAESYDENGKKDIIKTEKKNNKQYFSKPLVILVNNGVRSGKEALAYQFKKTQRGTLIGAKTPGYFTVGQFLFADEDLDYVLYLCKNRLTLDDKKIEGVGIKPDIKINFSTKGEYQDSQLERGLRFLSFK